MALAKTARQAGMQQSCLTALQRVQECAYKVLTEAEATTRDVGPRMTLDDLLAGVKGKSLGSNWRFPGFICW